MTTDSAESDRGSNAILIAAQSGRALAQAARRAGLRPFVLDLFGDDDTLALAHGYRKLAGRFGETARSTEAVTEALDELASLAGSQNLGVVLGSGFEGSPALIAEIAARHRLIGASAETVALLKDPLRFAGLCRQLAIPHPVVTTDPVPNRDAWLSKSAGGSGGTHIVPATQGRAPPGRYFQARAEGRPFALNVLADGRDIAVLALSEQWSEPSPVRPFRFAGAIVPGRHETSGVAEGVRTAIIAAIARLTEATGLRGLASADLLIDGADWWLLEINPRPGATLDPLDRRAMPLLAAHIEASLRTVPRLDPPPMDAAGLQICYAPRRYACIPPVDWPDFVRDRPRTGSSVGRDAPFCTLIATGADAENVKETLRARRAQWQALLDQKDRHAIQHPLPEHQRADGSADRPAGR